MKKLLLLLAVLVGCKAGPAPHPTPPAPPPAPHLLGASYPGGPAFVLKASSGDGPVSYSTWSSLSTAMANVPGIRFLYPADQDDHITTGGPYDLNNVYMVGNGALANTLHVDVGATFTTSNLDVRNNLFFQNDNTSTPFTLGSGSFSTVVVGEAAVLLSTTSAPLITTNSDFGLVVQLEGSAKLGDGTHCVISTGTGVHTVVTVGSGPGQGATLSAHALCGLGTVRLGVDAAANFSQTQDVSTLTVLYNDLSSQLAYTPATPGNWSPAPTLVNGALDQLATRSAGFSPDAGDVVCDGGYCAVQSISGTPTQQAGAAFFPIQVPFMGWGANVGAPSVGMSQVSIDAGGDAAGALLYIAQGNVGLNGRGGAIGLASGFGTDGTGAVSTAMAGRFSLICGGQEMLGIDPSTNRTVLQTHDLLFAGDAGVTANISWAALPGTGDAGGKTMNISGQPGQTVGDAGTANNNGGDLNVSSGFPGGGGTGGTGVAGALNLRAGTAIGISIQDGGIAFFPHMHGLGGSGFACNHTNLSTGEVSAAGADCLTAGGSPWVTALDCDITAQSSQTLNSNGTFSTCGFTWTAGNTANASPSMTLGGGSGLTICPTAGSNLGTTHTLPFISIPITSLFANLDQITAIRGWYWISAENSATNPQLAMMIFKSSASISYQFIARGFLSAPSQWINGCAYNSSACSNTAGVITDGNSVGLAVIPTGFQASILVHESGVFDGGWPSLASLQPETHQGISSSQSDTSLGPANTALLEFGAINPVSGSYCATISHIRLDYHL